MQTQETLAQSFIDGKVLLLDKPLGWTSFDVVNKIKALLKYRLGIKKIKIGHAGTLDPLATGLLIICTGKSTREVSTFQQLSKTYTGCFVLGESTPSFDLETRPDTTYPTKHITTELIKETAGTFLGAQDQVPPLFSAKKIAGKRAYTHARKGLNTELKANRIHIHDFEITDVRMPEVDFRIRCSKGTYIRSLASDFGKRLGSGAYLKTLRRTAIGDHDVTSALSPEALEHLILHGGQLPEEP